MRILRCAQNDSNDGFAKHLCNAFERKETIRLMFVQFRRYWRLLARYLRPHRLRMGLLAGILCSTICVQVVTPLVASRFIDQATSGGDMRGLVVLALLTMGLALGAQVLAVAETY